MMSFGGCLVSQATHALELVYYLSTTQQVVSLRYNSAILALNRGSEISMNALRYQDRSASINSKWYIPPTNK